MGTPWDPFLGGLQGLKSLPGLPRFPGLGSCPRGPVARTVPRRASKLRLLVPLPPPPPDQMLHGSMGNLSPAVGVPPAGTGAHGPGPLPLSERGHCARGAPPPSPSPPPMSMKPTAKMQKDGLTRQQAASCSMRCHGHHCTNMGAEVGTGR